MNGQGARNQIPRDPMQEPEIYSWLASRADSQEELDELIAKQRKHIFEIQHKLNGLAQKVCDTYGTKWNFSNWGIGPVHHKTQPKVIYLWAPEFVAV